eukprot:512015-Rhodomonas_salina.2
MRSVPRMPDSSGATASNAGTTVRELSTGHRIPCRSSAGRWYRTPDQYRTQIAQACTPAQYRSRHSRRVGRQHTRLAAALAGLGRDHADQRQRPRGGRHPRARQPGPHVIGPARHCSGEGARGVGRGQHLVQRVAQHAARRRTCQRQPALLSHPALLPPLAPPLVLVLVALLAVERDPEGFASAALHFRERDLQP